MESAFRDLHVSTSLVTLISNGDKLNFSVDFVSVIVLVSVIALVSVIVLVHRVLNGNSGGGQGNEIVLSDKTRPVTMSCT